MTSCTLFCLAAAAGSLLALWQVAITYRYVRSRHHLCQGVSVKGALILPWLHAAIAVLMAIGLLASLPALLFRRRNKA
jgi:hypothetical protein